MTKTLDDHIKEQAEAALSGTTPPPEKTPDHRESLKGERFRIEIVVFDADGNVLIGDSVEHGGKGLVGAGQTLVNETVQPIEADWVDRMGDAKSKVEKGINKPFNEPSRLISRRSH